MEKFNILVKSGDGETTLKQVNGTREIIEGVHCFSFKDTDSTMWGDFDTYNISHLGTGMRISEELDEISAYYTAQKRIINLPEKIQEGIELVKKLGFEYPLNK